MSHSNEACPDITESKPHVCNKVRLGERKKPQRSVKRNARLVTPAVFLYKRAEFEPIPSSGMGIKSIRSSRHFCYSKVFDISVINCIVSIFVFVFVFTFAQETVC